MQNDELEIVRRLTGIGDESRIEINEIGWQKTILILDFMVLRESH